MPKFSNQIIATGSPRARAAFALGIAEMVLDALKQDEQGYAVARDALDLAWRWEEGNPVSGAELAQYVDSDTPNDLGSRELDYIGQDIISAHVAVTLAIGLAARNAYEAEGGTVMLGPIWEVNDDSILEIVSYAEAAHGFDQRRLEKMAEIIFESDIREPGTPIGRQTVLAI